MLFTILGIFSYNKGNNVDYRHKLPQPDAEPGLPETDASGQDCYLIKIILYLYSTLTAFMKSFLFTFIIFAATFSDLRAQFNCNGILDLPVTYACTGDSILFKSTYSGTDKVVIYDWEFGD